MKRMLVVFLALSVAAAFPAFAQQAKPNDDALSAAIKNAVPTIDFTQTLHDENGKSYPDPFQFDRAQPDKKLPDTTLGAAACNGLNRLSATEQHPTPEEFADRGALCRKVRGNVAAMLEAGAVELIKKRIGLVYPDASIVLDAWCKIDPAYAAKNCGK